LVEIVGIENKDLDEYVALKPKEEESTFINNEELENSEIITPNKLVEDKENLKSAPNKVRNLLTPNEYNRYTFNIHHIDLKSGVLVPRKFYYVIHEALSDLGFNSLGSLNFWISFFILITVLWIRSYIHTFGSWTLLKMTRTPVDAFDPKLYQYA